MQGIHVTAYSPLGSPDSAEMMKRSHKQAVMDNPTVKEVASKHNKAAAEVSLPLFVYGPVYASWKAQGLWLHSYDSGEHVVLCGHGSVWIPCARKII